jgi:predicted ATPase
MKYADLIQFDPIDSVIELRKANEEETARNLVKTYKISENMAGSLSVIFDHLQFKNPADNKGVFIVGNYGTGKSHLMAIVSAIAEHSKFAKLATNDDVCAKAPEIAGQFKVIRIEIGATKKSLRDIICDDLESGLKEMDVQYSFPDVDEKTGHKDSFGSLMETFQQKYKKKGLLLVVDELLDYLRTRKEQDLIFDLNFLRELGEICQDTRFRFMAGIQESLFDTAAFQFVAKPLVRVKDRFQQITIAKADVAYVVSERLLQKTDEQRELIREHLSKFAPLYESLTERMDEFVHLFPVHPAYIDIFQKLFVAEKREVLKTISKAIKERLKQNIPEDEPGLIAYDSYWKELKANQAFRTELSIRQVSDKSSQLEDRIEQAFPKKQYKAAAIRIIHGLSLHRLTTDDIDTPFGPTSEELRDDLCLMLPSLPEKDAGFLKSLIETVLEDILRTVNGQFISKNEDNNQYYLDLKKDIDFDALIINKSEQLKDEQLDRHYFDALAQVMECTDRTTHMPGYRIWEHQLEWREKKAERSGYLFFGAPNERDTVHPPRDFYLYFLQPHEKPKFKDEKKSDEVFFRLDSPDEAFNEALKKYAGAKELSILTTGQNKKIYADKAIQYLKAMTTWLKANMTKAFQVTCKGKSSKLGKVIQGKVSGETTVRELVNTTGAVCLAPKFEDDSPDYPAFGILITVENREQAATAALCWIGGGLKTNQGTDILDSLQLLDGDNIKPQDSRYAKDVLDALEEKKPGQVLTRKELIQDEVGIEYWGRFRLEPEFLAVVLAALVRSGDIILSIPGNKLDAGKTNLFATTAVADLAAFKHIERPKGISVAPLKELFTLLGLNEGLIVQEATRGQAVEVLQTEIQTRVDGLVLTEHRLEEGFLFWDDSILSEEETGRWKDAIIGTKNFLESLQVFNAASKLANFPYDEKEVKAQKPGLDLVNEISELQDLIDGTQQLTNYLTRAQEALPAGHDWNSKANETKGKLIAKIKDPKKRSKPAFQMELSQGMAQLKTEYQDEYLELYKRAHLSPHEEEKKVAIANDSRLKQLRDLAAVEMMPTRVLVQFENDLLSLRKGAGLTKRGLENSPICDETRYRPSEQPDGQPASTILKGLDKELDKLVKDWTAILLSNLEDASIAASIELITDSDSKAAIRTFLKDRKLPETITPALQKALSEVLAGLDRVELNIDQLTDALKKGGIPCTVAELEKRFNSLLSKLTKGKDDSKVRVIVD